MEKADVELIQRLKGEIPQLARYWVEHEDFERKLEALEKKGFLSTVEEAEMKRLKKLKLQGRDEMQRILAEHRQAV